ncbi:polymorphic toxin type 23 domain-containing protein [Chryseobacterium sp. S0630]|uniref:polymorphic toxin type 23 domain-containing protein n=1 Tax=Chryseobacterium sp. S0630 TaxID=2957803 RepID=UPI0020A13E82|nr:polymorphic toxin type 23 domain-containing protein [Chryseobacterium sp. S0630]MCP1300224.1 polymorphic toxin type 23 domain-containing protein [Chryseobacterium sp. S0630]
MKKNIYFLLAFFFLAKLLNAQAVGQTTGDFSVSSTGGANYTIPIANLPGIKNAVPNITLNYSSQSKNGIAGWGWNVSGASSITRISATKFHDGVIDAVNYNDKDRFALDGQRLILKSGTYGGDGAEYQTENYSNIKVISYGVSSYGANYGPSYFIVYYPNGNTAIYGNNPNSQSQLEWKVNHIDDVKYNRIEFSYFKDNDNIYLSSVKYGGNPSVGSYTPVNTVNLVYKNRTRNEQMYVYGNTSYVITKELDKVEVLGNGQLFRKYQLTYDTTSLGYERLTQVQEFNGNGESVKPIIFEYDTTENGVINNPNAVISNVTPAYDSNNWKYLAGYFDNDASIDFFTYPNSKDKLYRFNSSQLLTTNSNVAGNLINIEKFSDIFSTKLLLTNNKFNNLDAVTTIGTGSIVSNQEVIKVNNYVSNSSYSSLDLVYTKTYSFPVAQNQSCVIIGGNDTRYAKIPKKFFTGDFNGDGLSDVIALTLPYSQTYTYYCGSTKLDPNGRPSPNCCEGDSTMEYSQAYLLDLNPNSPQTPINIGGNYVVKSSSRIYVGDLEGDGKADLFILNGGQITVYGVENNALVQKTVVNNSVINFDYPSYLTDLNGDGKTDIVIPTAEGSSNWFHLISNGQSFTQATKDISMVFRKSYVKNTCYNAANGNLDCGYVQQVIYYNFADVNGDGKADLFYHSIFAPYNYDVPGGAQWNYPYNTYGANYAIKEFGSVKYNMSNDPDGTANFSGENMMWNNMYTYNGCTANGTPMFLSNQNIVNQNLDYAFFGGDKIKYISFKKDNRVDTSLKRIKENDLVTNITYDAVMDNGGSSGTYVSDNSEQYPNVSLNLAPSIKLVKKIEKSFNGEMKIQEYRYKGAVVNMEGLGFIGFKGLARSSVYGGSVQPFWTISLQDPQKRGAVSESYVLKSVVDFNSPTSFISKTINSYNTSLSPNKVFTNLPTQVQQIDNLSGVTTNHYYDIYDTYNNPKKSRIVVTGGEKTTLIDYEDNPSGVSNQYYIGRPTKKTETQTLGNDIFSTEELFSYTNGLLAQSKKKGNNTDYITEDFVYDAFGNNIEKTLSATGVSPRTEKNQYDPSGRFAIKTTNIQGISTSYNYDSAFGLLLSTTNHLNQTLSYTYDDWQRKVQDKDIYNNITQYSYEWITSGDFSGGIKLKVTEATGATKETLSDNWGRIRIERGLSLNNKWIEKRTDYDILDKPFKVSEPYFSTSSPNKWTITEYDDYGRIVKTIYPTGKIITSSYNGLSATVVDGQKTQTITKDAWGNKIKMSDNGGDINYTYFANGSLKSSNYAGHVVSIEQDGWGRKIKLSDASVGGDYTYLYDNLGQILKEENPKGKTEYTYDQYGRVSKKNVTGDNTDIKINYSYNAQGLIDSETGTSNGVNDSYTYKYDNFYRLSEREENNGFAIFKKRYTYDNFGRVKKEIKETLYGSASSIVEVENNYASCGMLESITDSNGKLIWKLNNINEKVQVLSANFGNGTEISNTYDGNNFLSSVRHKNNVSGIVLGNDYTFEAATGLLKNRNSVAVQSGWYESFEYDSLQRLISWTDPNGTQSQTYDNYGRIDNNSDIGDYKYVDGNRYRKKEINLNPSGNAYYSVNQLQKIFYNSYKSPVSIIQDGYEMVKFGYNMHQTRSSSQYNYDKKFLKYGKNKIYSDDNTVEIVGYNYVGKVNGSALKTRIITYIAGNPYSAPAMYIKDFNGFGEVMSEGTHYLHRDYQGTISAISDQAGKVEERRQFDAWGNLVYFEKDGVKVDPKKADLLIERGYTGHEHFFQVGLIHMNGRMYDPKLHTFLSVDNYIQDPFNTQSYNRFGYVLNNPLMYTDPSGEVFVWAVVYVAAIVGAIMGATSYVGQAIQTGDWSWGKFGMSILGGAVSGAIMGTLTAATGGAAAALSWGAIAGYAATGFVGSFMSFNLDLGGGFSIGISPAIAFGNSFSVGASLSVSYRKGNLSFSAAIAGTYYNKHAGSGVSGWGYRYSAMIGYDSKDFSIGVGTNVWKGVHAQQTGIFRAGSGDFSLTYENDGSPFDKVGAGILGDGHDRWRTAAMTFNYRDFHAGFNLFTGERRSESYSYDEQHTMPELLHDDYYGNPDGKIGIGFGARNKYGAVQEIGPRYRLGAAYIGWGNYRIGIDSDRHIRHPIQNIGAHSIISPQPGFEVLSGGVKPYFQYQTINPFTSW